MDNEGDYQTYYSKEFTLIELLAVIVISGDIDVDSCVVYFGCYGMYGKGSL